MLEAIVKTDKQTGKVKRKVGRDLVDTAAHNSAQGTEGVFRQLVGNSHDADAMNTRVTIEDKLIVIEDDGHGMSRDEVENKWMTTGERRKLELKTSPKGRKYLGGFGVASASIFKIAEQYTLITAKDGQLTELTERVKGRLSTETEHNIDSYKCDKRHHGLRLEIRDLKFMPTGGSFSLAKLINYLQLTLPIGDHTGFNVYVNNAQLKPVSFENARVFRFAKSGIYGEASGFMYLMPQAREDAGIYVKVHGEVQAEPDSLIKHFEKINTRIKPKLVAIIHADGLKNSCRLNRDGFNDTPEFAAFVKDLEQELRLVGQFADQIHEAKRGTKNKVNIKKQLQQLSVEYCRAQLAEVDFRTKFLPGKDMPAHVIALRDPTANTFRINDAHESIQGAPSGPFLYHVLLHGVAEAVALERATRDVSRHFLEHKHEVMRKLAKGQKPASLGVTWDIIANAYYKDHELIKPTGLVLPAITYLLHHSLLEKDNFGILGSNVLDMQAKIGEYIILPEFAQKYTKGDELGDRIARIHSGIQGAGDYAMPFVVDLSDTNRKCYAIEPTVASQLGTMMQSMLETGKWADSEEEFKKFGERHLSVSELNIVLGRKDMTDVILFEKLGFEVRTNGNRRDEKYHFGDCVKALQVYRNHQKIAAQKK